MLWGYLYPLPTPPPLTAPPGREQQGLQVCACIPSASRCCIRAQIYSAERCLVTTSPYGAFQQLKYFCRDALAARAAPWPPSTLLYPPCERGISTPANWAEREDSSLSQYIPGAWGGGGLLSVSESGKSHAQAKSLLQMRTRSQIFSFFLHAEMRD